MKQSCFTTITSNYHSDSTRTFMAVFLVGACRNLTDSVLPSAVRMCTFIFCYLQDRICGTCTEASVKVQPNCGVLRPGSLSRNKKQGDTEFNNNYMPNMKQNKKTKASRQAAPVTDGIAKSRGVLQNKIKEKKAKLGWCMISRARASLKSGAGRRSQLSPERASTQQQ